MASIVRRSPSSNPTRGSYPIASRAALTSAHDSRTSPGCAGPNSFSTGLSRIAPIVSASVLTVSEPPVATFSTRPTPSAASAARRFAATTFSTYVKSRDCSPSPWTVTGLPSAIARIKRGTTAAYCDVGSWRGPNTLKYRRATVSIPYTRVKLTQKRSAPSFATA